MKLRNEGVVATDIDAAVFDTTTGTLGLFQLKWQDPFGTSMRKRNSKMMNFFEETNRWVSTVSSILLENPRALDHLLGERAVRIHDTKRIHLFVIGRHFSHFSGGTYRDSRAAWGTWPQVLRLFKESHMGFRSSHVATQDAPGTVTLTKNHQLPLRPTRCRLANTGSDTIQYQRNEIRDYIASIPPPLRSRREPFASCKSGSVCHRGQPKRKWRAPYFGGPKASGGLWHV